MIVMKIVLQLQSDYKSTFINRMIGGDLNDRLGFEQRLEPSEPSHLFLILPLLHLLPLPNFSSRI